MAGIIKAGQRTAGGTTTQPVAFQLTDVSDQANAYVAAARAQAKEILAAAQREAEAVRKKAEQQGLQAAIDKAEQSKRRELAKQVETLLPALKQSVAEFEQARTDWLRHWEKSAIGLASAIASRIIRREVAADPQITLELVRESLELAAGQAMLRIHLHPEDAQSLGPQVKQLGETWNRAAQVEVSPDGSVPKGSCRITTEFGDIDQRFGQQLARIAEELQD